MAMAGNVDDFDAVDDRFSSDPVAERDTCSSVVVRYKAWNALFAEYLHLVRARRFHLLLADPIPSSTPIDLEVRAPTGLRFRLSMVVVEGASLEAARTEHAHRVGFAINEDEGFAEFKEEVETELLEQLGPYVSESLLAS